MPINRTTGAPSSSKAACREALYTAAAYSFFLTAFNRRDTLVHVSDSSESLGCFCG